MSCATRSRSRGASDVFAQVPGSGNEQQLFHGVDAPAERARLQPRRRGAGLHRRRVRTARAQSACFADDGKGLRTVTEGDVIDRAPRWAPGGRAEIVYASAGIGRTKSGQSRGAFTVRAAPAALQRQQRGGVDGGRAIRLRGGRPGLGDTCCTRFVAATKARRRRHRLRDFQAFFAAFFGARRQPRCKRPCRLTSWFASRPKAHSWSHATCSPSTSLPTRTSSTRTQAGVFRIAAGQTTPEPMSALWNASNNWSFTGDLRAHCALSLTLDRTHFQRAVERACSDAL